MIQGTYDTADGNQRSFFTLHLYLNDSKQSRQKDLQASIDNTQEDSNILIGGATTFYSQDLQSRVDVDPKVGRVLLFQQKGLLHSGDEVKEGVKFTMRSDLMYEMDLGDDDDDGDIVFG